MIRGMSMMKDPIERQAAIKALGERPIVWAGSDYGFGARNQYDKDLLAIETVPSVHPNGPDNLVKDSPGLVKDLVNDCISRKAAIDEVINLWADKPFGNPALVEIKDCIEKLPSAQPETADCIYCHEDSDGYEQGLLEVMGNTVVLPSDGDSVAGFLTAQDVIDRLERNT